jgi:hypothetical protein
MIKRGQIDLLSEHDFHYISAITKPQIHALVNKGVIQLGLFDDQLCEVTDGSTRYILRRNPMRQREIAASRKDRLRALAESAEERTKYLADHPKARPETALEKVQDRCSRYGLADFVHVELVDRAIILAVDDAEKSKAAALDGCYVLRTDLPAEAADMETIHGRYKDLALVEKAFRTWKTGGLELRPIFVRSEASTRGHVFVVMLAYLIERELAGYWRDLDTTVAEGIDELGALCGMHIKGEAAATQKLPQPNALCGRLLEAADIRLPHALPLRKTQVATRQKLTERRKKLRKSAD